MSKTPEYQKRALEAYIKRHNLINYSRRIKPAWKPVLDDVIKKLKIKEKM